MRYDEWIRHVDRAVQKRVGVSLDELPDWLSRDAFDEGLTPKEAVDVCLEQTGFWDFEEELIDEL